MFHQHNFQKHGNTLYCNCGKIKDLPCCHEWNIHHEEIFSNSYNNKQLGQTLICKNCGEIKNVNLTTGEIK